MSQPDRYENPLSPEALESGEPERCLPGRNVTKADVLVYRLDGRLVAVKTYASRPAWVRQTLGRWLIRREAAAYRAAAGIDGLPAFLGRLGPHALATAWIEARPLSSLRGEPVDGAVFDAVAAIVGALHERGVAVADLHHRDVLLAADGSVFLVDLAMAWLRGRRPGRLRRVFFERLSEQDFVALARMRARWSGGDEATAVAGVGSSAAAWHARGRRVKAFLDRLRRKNRD